jgi:hypothetical protein
MHRKIVSSKEMHTTMHFASEERGEPKLHSLSPLMHLLQQVGPPGSCGGGVPPSTSSGVPSSSPPMRVARRPRRPSCDAPGF